MRVIFEELMVENFLKLMKDNDPPIQKAQWTINKNIQRKQDLEILHFFENQKQREKS